MKIRCPRCKNKLSIPDKYAGKAIRCPSCNRAITVPSLKSALGGSAGQSELDLEGLAQLEARTTEMSDEERTAVESTLAAQRETESAATGRVCPYCRYETKSEDPNAEILCPHCGKAIPASTKPGGGKKQREQRIPGATGAGGFYSELATSVTYPFPALTSLLTAAGIAFGAALVPVMVMTAAANLMQQSQVGTTEGVQEADLSNVQLILIGIFGLEVFFFAAVAVHAFFDVVRTTAINDDAPPKLSFSPNQWGKSFVSYLLLSVYIAVMTYVVATLTVEGDIVGFLAAGDVNGLLQTGGTAFGVGMLIVLFLVPMNLLGISLGSIGQALNPMNVFKSVVKTHAHYVFLVLTLLVYGGLFGYAFSAVLFDWFLPQMEKMTSGSSEGNILDVAWPLNVWGVVMIFFFYGSYVLARLHGLFARSFRKQLLFGTQ